MDEKYAGREMPENTEGRREPTMAERLAAQRRRAAAPGPGFQQGAGRQGVVPRVSSQRQGIQKTVIYGTGEHRIVEHRVVERRPAEEGYPSPADPWEGRASSGGARYGGQAPAYRSSGYDTQVLEIPEAEVQGYGQEQSAGLNSAGQYSTEQYSTERYHTGRHGFSGAARAGRLERDREEGALEERREMPAEAGEFGESFGPLAPEREMTMAERLAAQRRRPQAIPQESWEEGFGENPAMDAPSASAKREEGRQESRRRKKNARTLLERRMSLIAAGMLVFGFGAATLLMLLLPRSTKSMIEKRELAKLPEFSLAGYFSGEFTAGVATYFTDTVPNRDGLKNAGNNFKGLFGLPKAEDSVEFVGAVNKVNPANKGGQQGQSAKPEGSPEESTAGDPVQMGTTAGTAPVSGLEGAAGRRMNDDAQAPAKENNFVNEDVDGDYNNGLLVIKQDGHFRALELFGGGSGDDYAQGLNELYDQVGGSGVNVWSMPAPLASEFYTPRNYQEYTNSQSDCFDKVAGKLNQGIRSINICPVLSQHVEEPIYCRTDHHWQPLGAYYAAQEFAKTAALPFDDLSSYDEGKIEGFVGSMYSFSESSDILNDPEDFVYYRPKRQYETTYYTQGFGYDPESVPGDDDWFQEGAAGSNAYLYYLYGDGFVVKTNSDQKNGRTLLLIKDSYGNAIAPFLTGSFEKIFVADVRYLERNLVSFVRDMGVTDVLFTMTSYSVVGEAGSNISTLVSQNAGETVTDDQPAAGTEGAGDGDTQE